jgi:DNA-binding GntR family transcriptional regulator
MTSSESAFTPAAAATPVTLRMHAEAQLREAVITGGLAPGSRVNEVECASALGVSRGVVREALRALEQEGLVVARPRHGVYVRQLTKVEAHEISEVRLALEVTAARRIARGGLTDDVRATLEERYADLEALIDEPYPIRARADLAFHEAICACSGNGALLQNWRSLMAAYTVMLLTVGPDDGGILLDPSRHRPLLDAIEDGDVAEIESAWVEHFGSGVPYIVDHLPERAEGFELREA